MLENLLCSTALKCTSYAQQMPPIMLINYQQSSFPAETVIIIPENSLALRATLTPFGSVE